MLTILRAELPLLAGAATFAILSTVGAPWLADLTPVLRTGALFVWVFSVTIWCAFRVVHHADILGELLGEPLGTLILTFAVVGIEVSLITAIMLSGGPDPALARDTMFAVLMIVLNGIVGTALLIGGFRHKEQDFNLQGARAFLAVVTPLAVITLILPDFTRSTEGPFLSPLQSVFFGGFAVVLYAVFLVIQTSRHRSYFIQPGSEDEESAGARESDRRAIGYHAALLFLTMLPVVLLSKKLAILVEFGGASLGAPTALGGVLIAIIVLSPEAMTAFEAAAQNKLQRAVNICLGSALSTIAMTVPAVLVVGLIIEQNVILGLSPANTVLLALTLVLSTQTFGGNRTNLLQGAVHLVLFFVYLTLIFSP